MKVTFKNLFLNKPVALLLLFKKLNSFCHQSLAQTETSKGKKTLFNFPRQNLIIVNQTVAKYILCMLV